MGLMNTLSLHSPFLALMWVLALIFSVMLIISPNALLKKRSWVLPKRTRNARIVGIVLLASIVVLTLLLNILTAV